MGVLNVRGGSGPTVKCGRRRWRADCLSRMEEAPESRISLSHKAVINKVFDDRMTESVGVGPISVSLAWGPATVIASCGPAGEHGARGSGVAELVVVNKVVVVVVVSVHACASGLRGGGEGRGVGEEGGGREGWGDQYADRCVDTLGFPALVCVVVAVGVLLVLVGQGFESVAEQADSMGRGTMTPDGGFGVVAWVPQAAAAPSGGLWVPCSPAPSGGLWFRERVLGLSPTSIRGFHR